MSSLRIDLRSDTVTLPSTAIELLWPLAVDDDEASAFVRALIVELATQAAREAGVRRAGPQ